MLDIKAAARELRYVPEIVADDLEHAEAIDAALRATMPMAPRLMITEDRKVAA